MRFCSKIAADKLSYISFSAVAQVKKQPVRNFHANVKSPELLSLCQSNKRDRGILIRIWIGLWDFFIEISRFSWSRWHVSDSISAKPLHLGVKHLYYYMSPVQNEFGIFFSTYVLLKGNFNHSSWTIELITQPFESGFAFPQKDLNRLRTQHILLAHF